MLRGIHSAKKTSLSEIIFAALVSCDDCERKRTWFLWSKFFSFKLDLFSEGLSVQECNRKSKKKNTCLQVKSADKSSGCNYLLFWGLSFPWFLFWQEQRKEILIKITSKKVSISESAMKDLDLDAIAQRTEGYLARDLVNVVSRAVHAYILANGPGIFFSSTFCLHTRFHTQSNQ